MRTMLLSLAFLPALAAAQQAVQPVPPQGSNWQHVQALPAGTSVQIKARPASLSCKLVSVAEDALTCNHGKDVTVQRADIRSIRIPRRGRSTLIGGGIGAGVGVLVGIGVNGSLGGFGTTKAKASGAGAAIFTPLGLIIGAATDFSKSTVYRAP